MYLRVEQRDEAAAYGGKRRGYHIQINQEAGFMIYSRIKRFS